MATQTKICSNKYCEEDNPQPLKNFYKDRSTADGYKHHCKKCILKQANKFGDKVKQNKKDFYKLIFG